ncbi:hypothetical protein CQ10_33980 [Bradyrhizobium valentinum]|uniref:Uncharacterized protein n=1 Tax=Bradyrhizobium valentinum TaxID=1518501 RepID=A0A0R3K2H2_9BRAD|nr:hypothetical protein CP49_39130 [Bradyrhizobium valentinum]KRQ94450.1 hypothetical protein CQ10_33980 [Bradyrhizobium valentinum]
MLYAPTWPFGYHRYIWKNQGIKALVETMRVALNEEYFFASSQDVQPELIIDHLFRWKEVGVPAYAAVILTIS